MEEEKTQTLVWTVPECPFRVVIQPDVLNEIRILAVEAFYSVPRGGVEIGGVFFGLLGADELDIRTHRPIRCEYSTGPSFTLSVKDQLGLSGLLDRAPADPDLAGMVPLGWYHSHTRSEIFLSPADLQLYSEFFPEKWQIALVVRPTNLQATRGGFFFRDKRGNLKSDTPGQEFKMEPPDFGLKVFSPGALAPAVPPETPAPTVPVIERKPEEPPVVEAVTPLIEPAAPVEAPAMAAVVSVNGSGAATVTAPDITEPAPMPKAEPIAEPAPQKPEAETPLPVPGFALAQPAAAKTRKTGWMWALLILVLLGAGGSAAFIEWARIGKPVGLGLETYDINGAFLIRWDRTSSAFAGASQVTLEISDGGEKVDPIVLAPADLSIGGYGYMRHTDQVSVHMKVAGTTPLDEYSNFAPDQSLGSEPKQVPQSRPLLTEALQEQEHLKTELINESMKSTELRREITALRRQLAEARARNISRSNQ